jgi:hypothetical protein
MRVSIGLQLVPAQGLPTVFVFLGGAAEMACRRSKEDPA